MIIRKDAGGISNVLVIITVALAFIGLVTVYLLTGAITSLDEKIAAEQKAGKETGTKIQNLNLQAIKVQPLVLNTEADETLTLDKVKKYLDEKNQNYNLVPRDLNLQNIVYKAIDRLFESEYKLTRAIYEKNLSKKQEDKTKEFQEKILKDQADYLAVLKKRREELVVKKTSASDKYLQLKDQLNNARKDLEEKLPALTQKYQKDIIRLENERDVVKYTLEDLSSKEAYSRDIVESYGKVINPEPKNKFAFITLSANDRLRVGMKFMSYRQGQGNIKKWKGQLEVKKIFDTYSLVSITKTEDENNPITDGDYITNIFYHPTHSRYVVLIGKFKKSSFKYDHDEIEQRLGDMGTIVEKNVSLTTDFVLVGEDPEESNTDRTNFEWAKKLNIPRVEGEDLKKSLEYYLGD